MRLEEDDGGCAEFWSNLWTTFRRDSLESSDLGVPRAPLTAWTYQIMDHIIPKHGIFYDSSGAICSYLDMVMKIYLAIHCT